MLPRAKRFAACFRRLPVSLPMQPAIIGTEDRPATPWSRWTKPGNEHGIAQGRARLGGPQKARTPVALTGAGLFVGNRAANAELALAQRLPMMCADATLH